MRSILTVDDLTDDDLDLVLSRAAALAGGASALRSPGPLVGLLFLEPSLRTRVGFAAAAARLGGGHIEVAAERDGPRSSPESFEDTVRTLSGMVDVLVARPGRPIGEVASPSVAPVVNGGDAGPHAEHPTQALVDLAAIERFAGPVGELTVAVVGDLRMRATRSLLGLLTRRRPKVLVAITDDGLLEGHPLDELSGQPCERRAPGELDDVDVLYVAGMPHESLPLDDRERLLVGGDALAALPSGAVVLSPGPVVDEIAPAVRSDPRVKVSEQSDHAVHVRTALLELLLD
jgi:aspartate carbamoyltransferase catalytic subunit